MPVQSAREPTEQQLKAMGTYCSLMDELRARLQWIEYAANGRTGMDRQLVLEFGLLQLRMIVELIALGCLVAHGDIAESKGALSRKAGADEILNKLEQLHPDFYPVASVEAGRGEQGERRFKGRDPDYMTKPQLLQLYRRDCGNGLHRGSLKNLLGGRQPARKGYPELMQPAQRIANLLAFHQISLIDGDSLLLCHLVDPVEQKAKVSFATAFGSWQPPPAGPSDEPSGGAIVGLDGRSAFASSRGDEPGNGTAGS